MENETAKGHEIANDDIKESKRRAEDILSVDDSRGPFDGMITSSSTRTEFQIQMKDTYRRTTVENPENLVSNLCVDLSSTHGWMGAVKNTKKPNLFESSDPDQLPQVFQGCKTLICLLNPPSCKSFNNGETKCEDKVEGDKVTHDDAEIDTEIERLQELLYVQDIGVVMTKAISEVMKMTDVSNKNSRKSRIRKNYRQRSKKIQEDGFILPKDTSQSQHVKTEDLVPECATVRSTKSFNTLCVLIPILQSLLNHPQRNNNSIEMLNKPTKFKKKKHRQLYLFGRFVFSIVSLGEYEALQNDLRQLITTCNKIVSSCFEGAIQNNGQDIYSRLHEGVYDGFKDILIKVVPQTLKEGLGLGSMDDIFNKTISIDCVDLKYTQDEIMSDIGIRIDRELIYPLVVNMKCTRKSHDKSVRHLSRLLESLLSSRYTGVQLMLYGSCLSGLSLGMSSDVDISLSIPSLSNWKNKEKMGELSPEGFKKKLKSFVYGVSDTLGRRGGSDFENIQPVPFARVPVVKGQYKHAQNPLSNDGSLCFDICFLNEIAVVNSTLLKEYSLLDERVKEVMLAVKSWVKSNDVGSAANGTLSSYSWMVLVIFYLQCIGFVPCLQCCHFLKLHGIVADPSRDRWHGIGGLNTAFVSSFIVHERAIWKIPPKFSGMPTSFLLSGFFSFYARHFPYQSTAVSIRLGKCVLQKTVFKSARLWRMCIEDPFETHASHCPHDLGTHLSLLGQKIVFKELNNAAEQMISMFESNTTISGCFRNQFNVNKLQTPDPKRLNHFVGNGNKHHVHRMHHSQNKSDSHINKKKNRAVEDGHTKGKVKGNSKQKNIEIHKSGANARKNYTRKNSSNSICSGDGSLKIQKSRNEANSLQNQKKLTRDHDQKGNGEKRKSRHKRSLKHTSNVGKSENLSCTDWEGQSNEMSETTKSQEA